MKVGSKGGSKTDGTWILLVRRSSCCMEEGGRRWIYGVWTEGDRWREERRDVRFDFVVEGWRVVDGRKNHSASFPPVDTEESLCRRLPDVRKPTLIPRSPANTNESRYPRRLPRGAFVVMIRRRRRPSLLELSLPPLLLLQRIPPLVAGVSTGLLLSPSPVEASHAPAPVQPNLLLLVRLSEVR